MATPRTLTDSFNQPLDLGDPAMRARMTPAAIKAAARIADSWGLATADICRLLGEISERQWYRMKKGGAAPLGPDMLTRISALIGIFKGLRLLFSNPLADEWVTRPNRHFLFAGARPLDRMIDGGIPAMVRTRAYIDALRGGT